METKVIVGCPGAGKSTFLANMASKLPANDTLILTYSRSAANNIAKKAGPDYRASTIHALCFHNLGAISQQMLQGKEQVKNFCDHIGIDPPNSGFDRYDPTIHPWEVYSYARTAGEDVINTYFRYADHVDFTFMEYVKFVKSLQAYKEMLGLHEFHDLLERYNPTSAPANLLVDESQDNSHSLTKALEKLVMCGVKRLWMVGDPNQAIYTYSGADPKWMYHFGGREEFLEQSYRCPSSVVNKAKTLFPNAKFSPTPEVGTVKNEVVIPDDVDMVLVRTNYIKHRIVKQTGINPRKVLTIHKAKGLQGDHVAIVNSTTGKVRKSTELEPLAEKRVLYTGITRAKERLTIIDGNQPNEII